jgi:hypothetical protein
VTAVRIGLAPNVAGYELRIPRLAIALLATRGVAPVVPAARSGWPVQQRPTQHDLLLSRRPMGTQH